MIQGIVIANIPKTPQDVLMSDLVLAESVVSLLMTFYAAFSCGAADSWESKAQQEIKLFGINCRSYRAVDALTLILFVGSMIFINFYFIKEMMFGF